MSTGTPSYRRTSRSTRSCAKTRAPAERRVRLTCDLENKYELPSCYLKRDRDIDIDGLFVLSVSLPLAGCETTAVSCQRSDHHGDLPGFRTSVAKTHAP